MKLTEEQLEQYTDQAVVLGETWIALASGHSTAVIMAAIGLTYAYVEDACWDMGITPEVLRDCLEGALVMGRKTIAANQEEDDEGDGLHLLLSTHHSGQA